ncbi:MAG: family 16 glycoside hydrolase, partial [Opitutae bacterium]
MKTCLPILITLDTLAQLYAEEGWTNLFNGKDLTGWTASENKKSCKVQDGKIVLFGPRSHLFY